MIRAQQAPTLFHRHEAPKPAMTAFASAIFAALPGAGAQPEKAGTGATGGESVLGAFEAILAGLTDAITGDVAEDGKGDGAADLLSGIQTDTTVVDPTLAAASTVLPFAPLATGLPASQAEQAETVETGQPVDGAPTKSGPATVVDLVAEAALPTDGEQSVPPTIVADTGAKPAFHAVGATSAVQAPVAASPETPATEAAQPTSAGTRAEASVETATMVDVAAPQSPPKLPADVDLPTPTAGAVATSASAASAAVAAAARPVEPTKTSTAPVAKTDVAPAAASATPAASTTAARQEAASAVDTAAAMATAEGADVSVEAARAVAPVVVPPRPVAIAGETRRAASAAAAVKGDQTATAVSSYLDSLEGVEPKPGDEAVVEAGVNADAAPDIALVPVEVTETDEPERQAPAADVRAGATQSAAQTAEPPAASRTSAETVAKLSADIVRKLEGQSTKFDLQLDPHGLGKVDVSVEIDRDGRLTAALSFESAQAASDLKGRSNELRAALEQAGFTVSDNGLSFDMASQGGGFGGREANEQSRSWSGRAFKTAQTGLDEADARAAHSSRSRAAAGGVDIRI